MHACFFHGNKRHCLSQDVYGINSSKAWMLPVLSSECVPSLVAWLFQPTSMRAIRARYNPYLQTRHRVEQVRRHFCLFKVSISFVGSRWRNFWWNVLSYFWIVMLWYVTVAAGTVKSVSDAGCCCSRDSQVCVWCWLLLQQGQSSLCLIVGAVAAGTVKSVSDGGCCCSRDSQVCVWWWLLLQQGQSSLCLIGTVMSVSDGGCCCNRDSLWMMVVAVATGTVKYVSDGGCCCSWSNWVTAWTRWSSSWWVERSWVSLMIIVTTSFAVCTTLSLDTPAATWKRLSSEWCSAAALFHIYIPLLLLPLLHCCYAFFTLIYYYYFYHYCSAATAASTTTTPLLLHYKKEKKKQQQNNNSTVNGEHSVIFVLLGV